MQKGSIILLTQQYIIKVIHLIASNVFVMEKLILNRHPCTLCLYLICSLCYRYFKCPKTWDLKLFSNYLKRIMGLLKIEHFIKAYVHDQIYNSAGKLFQFINSINKKLENFTWFFKWLKLHFYCKIGCPIFYAFLMTIHMFQFDFET